MNGPDHFQEAERLLAKAPTDGPDWKGRHRAMVAEAQVHAILALTAATAGVSVTDDWRAVAG